jgi:hypothetical protein
MNNNSCATNEDIFKIKIALGVIAGVLFLVLSIFSFFMLYPFKTVDFVVPIAVTNPDHKVPYNGTVNLRVFYKKHINNPGIIIRTLIRKNPDGEITVLDSSTVVSTRKKGMGESDPTFVLNGNPGNIGKNCYIVFSIHYTLYRVRGIIIQYESEPFEICAVEGCHLRLPFSNVSSLGLLANLNLR